MPTNATCTAGSPSAPSTTSTLTPLLGLNGLRVSEACQADITDLGGNRYTPTLHIIGKGDKPAEIVLNPRTQHALDHAINDRPTGPILHNQRGKPSPKTVPVKPHRRSNPK